MRIERARVRRVAEGEDAEKWRAALEQPRWIADAKVLKEEDGAWVRRATLLGRDVVVKCRPLNTWTRRTKSALRLGHADKQWRGAEVLGRAGIRTGAPVAIACGEVAGCASELLVLAFVPGKSLLRVLDEIARGEGPPVREQHAIARAVGVTVAMLRRKRIANRDHKPSNIIVIRSTENSAEVAVIDCVGVMPNGWGEDEDEWIAARLLIESMGCGCRPRGALCISAFDAGIGPKRGKTDPRWVQRCSRRVLAQRIAWIVRKHGDPRPRVNPLAHP